ncbi:MAG: aminoacyl-tRNA hydrolase [Patescibacteria group bacterium]
MKLIVGLGNPGEKHEKTRHNLGFLVLDRFLRDFSQVQKTIWEDNKKFKCDMAKIDWQPKKGILRKVILVKPKTYMNNSGLCVGLVSSFYKINPSDIWIIHDEIDLPLGSMKIRLGGGSAGHKGVMSIMNSLGMEKFWRFRLGIGHPRLNTKGRSLKIKLRGIDDFVLKEFAAGESGKTRELIKKASKSIQTALEENIEKAMNRFNTK